MRESKPKHEWCTYATVRSDDLPTCLSLEKARCDPLFQLPHHRPRIQLLVDHRLRKGESVPLAWSMFSVWRNVRASVTSQVRDTYWCETTARKLLARRHKIYNKPRVHVVARMSTVTLPIGSGLFPSRGSEPTSKCEQSTGTTSIISRPPGAIKPCWSLAVLYDW